MPPRFPGNLPLACPREYQSRPDAELVESIRALKRQLGGAVTILGHHYQGDAIVELSDFVGDSFQLCRSAAAAEPRNIVFCGVRFMAESARILARPEQVVVHPEENAGCPMADMATLAQAREAWDALAAMRPGRRVVPVTYMNSNADIKAFCGSHGGVVCTSSNAARVFEWAWTRGDTILFLPDEHLGRNTAHALGLAREEVLVWNPLHAAAHARDDRYARARLVVWKGFCIVHQRFGVDRIRQMREEHPDAFVMVHPECPREVVAASDAAGSTEAIVRRAESARPGETLCIGTEINLVARLAKRRPDVRILPLLPSLCLNMAKITPAHLLWSLENLGAVGVVEVEPSLAADARRALQQMLEIG